MYEQEICGVTYRINELNAFDQLHVVRRLAPVLHSAIFFAGEAVEAFNNLKSGESEKSDSSFFSAALSSKDLLVELAQMPEDDLNYVLIKVLSNVSRPFGKGWAPLVRGGVPCCDDLSLGDMLAIVVQVLVRQLRPTLTASGLFDIAAAVRKQMMSKVG